MKLNFINILKCFIAYSLILLGFVRRARKKAMDGEHILAIYFHNPSIKEFEYCIKWLKRKHFHFIAPIDLIQIIQNQLPLPKGAVLITVDDGWKSNEKNMVSVAEKLEVPITIFVSTEPVENGSYWWTKVLKAKKDQSSNIPTLKELKKLTNKERLLYLSKINHEGSLTDREAMDIDQIKRIAKSKYVHIGAHTHTHPILPNCPPEQVYEELNLSKNKLESWTGKKVNLFAYPNGDYTVREINMLKELNYHLAFTCEPAGISLQRIMEPYKIPRYAFLEGASKAENICRIIGVWQPLRDKLKWKYFNPSIAPTAYKYQNNSI